MSTTVPLMEGWWSEEKKSQEKFHNLSFLLNFIESLLVGIRSPVIQKYMRKKEISIKNSTTYIVKPSHFSQSTFFWNINSHFNFRYRHYPILGSIFIVARTGSSLLNFFSFNTIFSLIVIISIVSFCTSYYKV